MIFLSKHFPKKDRSNPYQFLLIAKLLNIFNLSWYRNFILLYHIIFQNSKANQFFLSILRNFIKNNLELNIIFNQFGNKTRLTFNLMCALNVSVKLTTTFKNYLGKIRFIFYLDRDVSTFLWEWFCQARKKIIQMNEIYRLIN